MKKAALHNLGCKVNAYEARIMGGLLEEAGYEVVDFREWADVYVVNTCSVTNIADRKSRQMLHRAKKQNPAAVVVAVGCYAQAAAGELEQDPAVDLVVGNENKKDLATILERYFSQRGEAAKQEAAKGLEGPGKGGDAGHTRAFIKVQDGCNQFCSYCIIPYLRGRVRSRSPEDVEGEVRALAASGYREVVLTGIHLSSYGTDFSGGSGGLLGLLRRLHPIEGLSRIRLGSLEPRIITRDFVAALAEMEKICPHFHLSLQSGCDETLKRMNRHYTTEEYEGRCGLLREFFPHPAITTDVIVGFPGETQEEFEETRAFLERIHFYEMHVFKYSKRDGTRAAQMPGQLPEAIKARRSEELLTLEKAMSGAYRRSFLGQGMQVLLEETVTVDGKTYIMGHSREYVKAAVPYGGQAPNTIVPLVPRRMLTESILC